MSAASRQSTSSRPAEFLLATLKLLQLPSQKRNRDYKDYYPSLKKDSARASCHYELNSLSRRLWQRRGFTILFLAAQIETSDWQKAVFLANAYCMHNAVSFCIILKK